MKLGLGTFAYAWAIGVPGHPPAQPMDGISFFRRAAALGLRLVQLGDNLPLAQMTAAELAALQAEAARLGIAVEVGTRGIDHANLRAYLSLAVRFGSPILRVVIDTATHHPSPDEVIATLCAIMPDFEAAGVTLAIENHDRFKVAVLANMVERISSPNIGICLDTVNSFGALEGPELVVATLGPYVVNLHVKDFFIQRHSHNMGFTLEGKPAGQGMLNLPWLLDRLRDFGCDFNAILELWPVPEAQLEDTIRKEDQWALESVRYLRTLIPD